MIEIIQQNEKTEENLEGKLPKNIRQIGNPEKDFRIYMEDYVYTYLHPAQMHGANVGILPRLLILLGEINHFSDRSCAFISGAIQVENGDAPEELPDLNEKTWRRIHKDMQRFFVGCEIVGWVLDIPGNTLAITKEMEETHQRNFVSRYQFFFLMDSMEREEAFYIWKEGRLRKKEGYFIYYEKNPQMQEYMISQREAAYGELSPTEEAGDTAAKNYRAMMMERKEQAVKREPTGILSYLTSILTVIALCAVSVLLLGNIRRMEDMEQTISVMSYSMESTEQKNSQAKSQVAVETVNGNILPLGEGQAVTMDSPVGGEGADEEPDLTAQKGQGTEREEELGQESLAGEAEPFEAGTKKAVQDEAKGGEAKEEAGEGAADEEPKGDSQGEADAYLAQGYYIVQTGDSLRKICYRIYQTDTMMDELCEANGIEDMDTIYVGQKILLP